MTNSIHYKSSKDILHSHGIIVLVLYKIFRFLYCFLFTRLWSKLSKIKLLHARDKKYDKATAWWQDIGVIIHSTIVLSIVGISFYLSAPSMLLLSVGIYFILDILCYHAGVLWFDDLEIGKAENRRMVWSHRRILFQAIINFVETIAIFAMIYKIFIPGCFWQICQQSFSIAITFNRGENLSAPNWIVNCQILISIFFLLVVISVLSSIGYSRPEIGKSFDK